MKGESRGDFSRDTFDPSKHFMRVLMQQGRVSLDADWNEQTDILLHYMQMLAKDLMGPFAGPEDADERGFGIAPTTSPNSPKSFYISRGRYYIDGILCENEPGGNICKKMVEELDYYTQPDYPRDISESDFELKDLPLLVYLDVWERHISYIEDDDIREKALGVADTASRSKVVWQVKALKSGDEKDWKQYVVTPTKEETLPTKKEALHAKKETLPAKKETLPAKKETLPANEEIFCGVYWSQIVENLLQKLSRGCLKAKAREMDVVPTEPCITSPESSYRGEENQLYRVEIHRGGLANGSNKFDAATFKWSRDNGTVAFPIISKAGNVVVLEHLGRDDRLSLEKDDWVEVVDDDYTLLIQSRPSPLAETRTLAQVDTVDMTEMSVTLKLQESSKLPDYPEGSPKHPLLRRWDHKKGDPTVQDEPELADDGALFVEEGNWLTLEDGIQIWFQELDSVYSYQIGDYWLVPARTATGDVEWPKDALDPDGKRLLPPQGIDHHYAPLAIVDIDDVGNWVQQTDCRCVIKKALNPPCGNNVRSKNSE